jgi:ABC-2 type transport system ATP-binding protein
VSAPSFVEDPHHLPPPTPHAVEVRELTKRYGRLRAVDALDLHVPEGGVFGLVGPNGAGKTTTMLAIVTLLIPDEGSITVFGHDPVTDPRAVRGEVGFVPDTFGLYDGLTCAEYLDFFAHAYELPRDQRTEQVDALLELVELTHKADSDVSGLSRGMQQRLSLARGLVHDPRLLVADEPASGLDPRARVDLREILLELSRQGKTILISSHILAELAEMCDRVGIIESGRMLAQGTPEEIRRAARPTALVTARLLGDAGVHERAVAIALGAGAIRAGVDQGVLRAELEGGEEAAADLLTELVGAGVRVVSYSEEHGGLEQLFLSVTKGVVR